LLPRLLEVDDLASQLALQLAQVASACCGARGNFDEPPAGLVDGDRERRLGELSTARIAPVRILVECPGDHGVHCSWQVWPFGRRNRRICFEVREHDGEIRITMERRPPDEAFVEHAAERVDVGSPVDLLTGDLLGGDILDRAHEVAVVGRGGLL
jgi:hypothetical protein